MENKTDEKPKKKFSFKEYYDSHPEFKKRHLEKATTKVQCDCGRLVMKSHLTRHKLTPIHQRHLTEVEKKVIDIDRLNLLEKELLEIKNYIRKNGLNKI